MNTMIKIVIFETNRKPYIAEIDGSPESLRNSISDGSLVKLGFKETKFPGNVIVYAANGIELRLKQNSWIDNIVGTFAVCKYIDNEPVNFDRKEIDIVMKGKF
jgi:hypothetical protein